MPALRALESAPMLASPRLRPSRSTDGVPRPRWGCSRATPGPTMRLRLRRSQNRSPHIRTSGREGDLVRRYVDRLCGSPCPLLGCWGRKESEILLKQVGQGLWGRSISHVGLQCFRPSAMSHRPGVRGGAYRYVREGIGSGPGRPWSRTASFRLLSRWSQAGDSPLLAITWQCVRFGCPPTPIPEVSGTCPVSVVRPVSIHWGGITGGITGYAAGRGPVWLVMAEESVPISPATVDGHVVIHGAVVPLGPSSAPGWGGPSRPSGCRFRPTGVPTWFVANASTALARSASATAQVGAASLCRRGCRSMVGMATAQGSHMSGSDKPAATGFRSTARASPAPWSSMSSHRQIKGPITNPAWR